MGMLVFWGYRPRVSKSGSGQRVPLKGRAARVPFKGRVIGFPLKGFRGFGAWGSLKRAP